MPRACTVCTSPHRAEIDKALVAGEPLRKLGKRTGTSPTSLNRHKSDHLSTVRHSSGVIVPVVPVQRGAGKPPLADHTSALRDRTMALLLQAERGIAVTDAAGAAITVPGEDGTPVPLLAVDFKAAAGLIREARGCLELEAKLIGELQSGVTVTVALAHPAVAARLDAIARVLARHPAVHAEVLAELDADRSSAPRRMA